MQTYFYAPQFTKFPPEIAKSLRRALYYTNIESQPELALKYYKKAMEQCQQMSMDPYSEEVIGLRIQIAHWLEMIKNYQNSVTALEALLRDINRWIEWMEKGVADGTLAKLEAATTALLESDSAKADIADEEPVLVESPFRKRTRLLAKAVGISVKLGDLYSDEHVMEQDKALSHLTWAVETALSESTRRLTQGLKEDEGDWMKPEEFGGAIEGRSTS